MSTPNEYTMGTSLIQYTKKGPPYIKTGGIHHDDRSKDFAISSTFSNASERCAVRGCTNTFATQPPKIFVPFPTQSSKRSRWLRTVGIDPSHPPSHKLFCCEDHFDLKTDVMHLSTLRSVNSGIVPNLLKDSVVPHKHTNSESLPAPPADSRDGGAPDEKMQVFIEHNEDVQEMDPLSSSSSEPTVKEEPDPESTSARSSNELIIISTSSLSELPNCNTRPQKSDGPQREVIRKSSMMSPKQTSVEQTNIHSSKTTPPLDSQVSSTGVKFDEKLKYQECAVRGCPHNLRTFPDINLVCVPLADATRKEWYEVIGRRYTKKSGQETLYVCTTHFHEDELEMIRPFGRSKTYSAFQQRVKHGVLPTLNLFPQEARMNNEIPGSNHPPRVPDLTPHLPSAMRDTPTNADGKVSVQPTVSNSRDPPSKSDLQKTGKPFENNRHETEEVEPLLKKYVPKTMPQYPECKHKTEEFQCSSLSVVDCSSFYSTFYGLDSRNEQNEFIFTHTEMVSTPTELEQPVFKFFIDQKKALGSNKRVRVCAQAFSTCLSFEITSLISLVTRHFDTILSNPKQESSVVLKPVIKEEGAEGDGKEDDIMIYEPVKIETVEIEDSQDEDVSVPVESFGEHTVGDVETPLTIEEELRQTVSGVVERTSGYKDHSKHRGTDDAVNATEIGSFETVHICDRCLAQFTSKANYEKHQQIGSCNRSSVEHFNCNLCGRTLSTFQDLKVHTNVYHKYVCPKCNDTFRYSRYLEDHILRCSGSNRLTEETERLIERITIMNHEIADTRKRKQLADAYNIPELECSVVLERMKIPPRAKQMFDMNEQGDASKCHSEKMSRLKTKVWAQNRRRGTRSSSKDAAEDSQKSPCSPEQESEEEVDVESTGSSPVHDKNRSKMRSKRKKSTSSEEEDIRKHSNSRRPMKTSNTEKNPPPPKRELRARKPINFAEPAGESDSEPIPELAGSGGESDDPNFDPKTSKQKKGRKRRRRFNDDSEDTSDSEIESPKSRSSSVNSFKGFEGPMRCGQCNSSFASITGLRAHHRLSEKCGKFAPGTIFKCDSCNKMFITQSMLHEHRSTSKQCQGALRTPKPGGTFFNCDSCNKMFISQTMLDEHRSTSKQCQGALRTPTPGDVDLLNCFYCDSSFNSLFNLRFHLKTSQDCLASARLRGEADEVSSIDDNISRTSGASVSSERRAHNLATGPLVCKCCKVVFGSNLGLGLHLKRSQKCIDANPGVDIPGVVDKSIVADMVSSSSTNADGESKSFLMRGIKRTDLRESNEEVVFVCVKCYSSFSSVWGLRTHERNSKTCKPDRAYEIPVPIPKEQAQKQKSEFWARKNEEKNQPSNSSPSTTSLSGTESAKTDQKPGFLMVYTQESQDEDGKFKCKSCSALFTSVWGLRTHQRISETCVDRNPPRFPRVYQRNQIILSEAAAKSIAKGENICPSCSAKFSTSWGLRTHLRTSNLCSESETNIKSDSKLSKEGQILTCSKCEMVFLQLKQLRDHVKYSRDCLPEDVTIAKNGRVQPGVGCFLCPQCPKTFKLPFSLDQHFVEHAPQKDNWPCHLCTKNFADQFSMHRHFHREHLGRWFCVICETKCLFISFKEFYCHIFNYHAKDSQSAAKYFKCPTCLKSFISKFSYDFHVSTCKKMADQVFHCASCHKVFNKKIHITNHMKYAHAGVVIDKRYKFKCPRCPRRFLSKKEYLQKHEKESCTQEEMPCEICGEMYSGFEKLKMHLEIAHKRRSELQSGKKSPVPGRKRSSDFSRRTPEPARRTLDPGRRTPEPGRKTLDSGRRTPEFGRRTSEHGRRTSEPGMASEFGTIDIASSSSSPAPSSIAAPVQEFPASPDSLISVSSVKIEPSSP